MSVRFLITLIALVVALRPLGAQSSPEDLFDKPESSTALDIPREPEAKWWIEVLHKAGLELTARDLKEDFTTQFEALRNTIASSLAGKQTGYLLKIQMYVDEFGTSHVPAGQLVLPIGESTTPLDALVQFFRTPAVVGDTPEGLDNQSYYIWLKNEGGKLRGRAIRREFRELFERRAREEDETGRQLNALGQAYTGETKQAIQQAQYWQQFVEHYGRSLANAQQRAQVQALVSRFKVAQEEFNKAYDSYQRTEIQIAEQQSWARALSTASTLSGIVQNAITVGALTSSTNSNASVKSDGGPAADWKASLEYSRRETDNLRGLEREQRFRLDLKFKSLQDLDSQLKTLFDKSRPTIPPPQSGLRMP